jgi:hypothetical protein
MPAWRERARYAAFSGNLAAQQQAAERTDHGARAGLIELAKTLGDGRVYAGLPTNWGRNYKVGFVPGYSSLLNHDADAIGFTFRVGSMVTDGEAYLDDRSLAQLNVFGVRYLLVPTGRRPVVPSRVVAARGSHALWEVPSSGYVTVVDTVEPITISKRSQAGLVQARFFNSAELKHNLYPTVAYMGMAAARPTASAAHPPSGLPGSVSPLDYRPEKGVFRAQVTANRTSAVVLKASYMGRWRVQVDGRDAEKYMVAPGYPAVTLQPGVHTVEFRYMPFGHYILLFIIGGAAFVLLRLLFPSPGSSATGIRLPWRRDPDET